MRIVIGALVGCVLMACARGRTEDPAGEDAGGGSGSDGGLAVAGTLRIDPPTSQLILDGSGPVRVTFTATLTAPDGSERDVTADTRFQIDPAFGAFAGRELTVSAAGKTLASGAYADKSATAVVTARVRTVRIDPSLPPDTADRFGGPEDPTLAPVLVYPPPDTAMPRNLGDFEIHWTDATNDVFEVSLHTEFSDVRVYVRGGNGLSAAGPTASWTAFLADEWLAAVGRQDTVVYQVRGIDSAAPGTVRAGAPQIVRLSNEVMDGGLYYWATATTATRIGIFRHDMNRPGEAAEEYITTDKTADRCVACHVLSRDGKRMSITYQDKNPFDPGLLLPPGPATIVNVETGAIPPNTQRWTFGTFTPDNAQFLAIMDGKLVVRDAASHAPLATMPVLPIAGTTTWVTHPDLSPDGTQLVYVRVSTTNNDFDFKKGQIYRRTYDAATRSFGPEIPVVHDGANNFHPSWSPDGVWILFNKNLAGNAYDDNNSSVWVVRADGTRPPVELVKANQALNLTNSWPRWAPFGQTLGTASEPMFWIAMSSKRDFGVRLRNTGFPQRAKRAQLWMTPFFPGRAAQGQDPSLPAFRLPFQSLDSSNHNVQWTERVVEVIP